MLPYWEQYLIVVIFYCICIRMNSLDSRLQRLVFSSLYITISVYMHRRYPYFWEGCAFSESFFMLCGTVCCARIHQLFAGETSHFFVLWIGRKWKIAYYSKRQRCFVLSIQSFLTCGSKFLAKFDHQKEIQLEKNFPPN